MLNNLSLNNGEKTLPPLCWQFNIYKKELKYDPQLAVFLGYTKDHKLNIHQLVDSFDSYPAIEVKKLLKKVMVYGEYEIPSVIISSPKQRYLAKLSLHYQGSKVGIIEGKIQFSQQLLNNIEESQLLRVLFNNAQTGLIITDINHKILMVNERFCKETGYAKIELLGQDCSILRSDRYGYEFYKNLWTYVDCNYFWSGELLIKGKSNNAFAHKIQLQRIKISDSAHVYTISSNKLDTSVELLRDQVVAYNENLHIPGKKEFTKKLEQVHQKLSRNKTIALAAFNVTSLQTTSKETVKWLISQRFNAANSGGHLGLINDDIFAAYWVIDKNADKINLLLHKTLQELTGGDEIDLNLGLTYTINMGVSVLAIDASSLQHLLSHSVQTLIANPHKNESSLFYFDRRLAKRFNRKEILTNLLKKALTSKTIEVYYQPIIELATMRVHKFEALFRIHLDTELDYDTQELINIAEEYEWIEHIDSMVTKIAVGTLPIIQKHYQSENIEIAINRSLASERIKYSCLEDTLNTLLAADIDLTKVTIELSDSGLFDDMGKQKFWVEKLRENGVKISIDDFATGYSSFSYLNKLPVNFIKIDRSFVTGVTIDSNEYAMIEMLCKLAHKMGAKVIAGGVESSDELTLLSRAKVDMLQGYFFSKPVSLQNLTKSIPLYYKEFTKHLYQEPVLTARDIMLREFMQIKLDDKIELAKSIIANSNSSYLIVTENSKCHGILHSAQVDAALSPYLGTKSEQTRDLATLQKRAHQVMSKEFYSLHFNSPLQDIKEIFAQQHNAVIIVTGDAGVCIGVITISEVLDNINTYGFRCNEDRVS